MSASPTEVTPGARRGARLAILGVGGLGLVVVARAAAFYLPVDRVAFALSLLIGAGLAFGIRELLGRVALVEHTLGELARLPRPATLEAIDAASPALRSVLRARLSGVRATVPTVGFASYLVGLLVLVGLLGTFLGLVDALRGAREALGASGDIDAMRTALATPMVGLSRAFGISAAGLSASAMLGLASIFARRAEVSLARAVHAYGDEHLGHLTVAERQLSLAERQITALEALLRQSAEASSASARSTEAILAATAAVRADVTAGVADLGRAVERALTPALERAVERASDVTRERLDEWSNVVQRDADERRGRDVELAKAWTDAAGASAARVGAEGARVLGEVRGVLGESLATLDRRLGASVDALASQIAARTTQIMGELDGRSARVSEDLEQRLATLTTTVGALVRGLGGELEGTRQRLDHTLLATTQALEAHAERTLTREREREEATEARLRTREDAIDLREQTREVAQGARVAELAAAEARALTRLERHVDAVDAALATHLERMTAMQLDATREATQAAAALDVVLREHAARLTTRTDEVLSSAARRAADAAATEEVQAARAMAVLAELASTTEQIVARTGRVLDEQAERQTELEARWLAAHEASASRLVALLTQHADGLGQGLTSTRALVDDAAGVLRASGVEMGAVAEVFTTAVDRYRDASAASLKALVGIDRAVDEAGKKAAVELLTDYLDQTREVFEHSLEVQRELYAELRALRGRGIAPAEGARVRA